jgi:hypothetical protein
VVLYVSLRKQAWAEDIIVKSEEGTKYIRLLYVRKASFDQPPEATPKPLPDAMFERSGEWIFKTRAPKLGECGPAGKRFLEVGDRTIELGSYLRTSNFTAADNDAALTAKECYVIESWKKAKR